MTTQAVLDPMEVLGNSRRMTILKLLNQSGGQIKLEGLIEALAEEEESEISAIRPTKKSLKTSLLNSHLPKLQSAGLVTFDEHSEDIVLKSIPPALQTRFETLLLSLYDLLRNSERN